MRKLNFYYDKDGNPYKKKNGVEPVLQWSKDFEKPDRILETKIFDDGSEIVTYWIGLDQSLGMAKKPLIYETAVFSPDKKELYLERYATKQEAIAGHFSTINKFLLDALFDEVDSADN